ncbi:alpha/beta-hydrolase [Thozetella sp. PMI_491]|nr:alpha/beta-hydrolase [Thozetella sp. PMI_491]
MGLAAFVQTLLAGVLVLAAIASCQDIPSVDLGYEVHTATVNETGDYYIFSNVPYADQPVGTRRFQLPVLPSGLSSDVNNGSGTVMCMQAYPEWIVRLQAAAYGVTVEQMQQILYYTEGQTEACLMLDIYVPAKVFDGSSKKAPVLAWYHGGGFTYGSKASAGNPAGLIARSQLNDTDGMIFVSVNYRLGLFGWLGGGDSNLTANLGFYDQRLALEWVAKYITLFGGDPSQVTVMGESAGASSILHHITSYGGGNQLPFSQAILQSPAFQVNLNLTDAYTKTLAEAANQTGASITTSADLASLDTEALKSINQGVVFQALQGQFIYGPAPDGQYVPELPQVLLGQGRFNRDVKVMASHNSLEAAPFVSQSIATEADLATELQTNFPALSNSSLDYILNELYPSSDFPYEFLRAVQIISDIDFSCATRYLGIAFDNETYNYIFAYPPGYHAGDVPYTFFNGDTSTLNNGYPVNGTLAHELQDYIVGFVVGGNPNLSPAGADLSFPKYGGNAMVTEFTYSGLVIAIDDLAGERCTWWQKAMEQGLV